MIFLGIVVVLLFSFNIIIEDTDLFKPKKEGQVLGTAIQVNEVAPVEQVAKVINYQKQINNIISSYLIERSEFEKPHQDWLFLNKTTKYKILNLSVPNEYREMHVAIVANIDSEYESVNESDFKRLTKVNNRWEEILDQFFWLTN